MKTADANGSREEFPCGAIPRTADDARVGLGFMLASSSRTKGSGAHGGVRPTPIYRVSLQDAEKGFWGPTP